MQAQAKIDKLQAKITRWETQLGHFRIASRPRWGESRRFAGRSAGNRLAKIDWLVAHLSDANEKIRQLYLNFPEHREPQEN